MLILTTDTLPADYEVFEVFGFIQATYPVQISEKGIIDSIAKRNRDEYQEAVTNFTNAAPSGANVIYGVKVTSAITPPDRGGRYHLILTYIGTAARAELKRRS